MAWHTLQDSEHFTYLQEQEAASSQTFCLDTYLSGLAKSNPTQETSCSQDSEMESCRSSRYGTTLKHLDSMSGKGALKSSKQDGPAKTSAQWEEVPEYAESAADYGLRLSEKLANYDLDSCSWKTPQCSLLEDSEQFSETWPNWGIMLDGVVWELPTAEAIISGKGYGFLPTLTASMWKGAASKRFAGSEHYRGSDMIEALREEQSDPCYIHPDYCEKAMRWPIKWSDLRPLATDKMQLWLQQHSQFSAKD